MKKPGTHGLLVQEKCMVHITEKSATQKHNAAMKRGTNSQTVEWWKEENNQEKNDSDLADFQANSKGTLSTWNENSLAVETFPHVQNTRKVV